VHYEELKRAGRGLIPRCVEKMQDDGTEPGADDAPHHAVDLISASNDQIVKTITAAIITSSKPRPSDRTKRTSMAWPDGSTSIERSTVP